MPCYHPLIAYGFRQDDGKLRIVFPKKKDFDKAFVAENGGEELQLPCGQCLGCRLEYSRQWAMRCVLEAKQWKHNYFLTLTYDDAHLPLREHYKVDKETGEVIDGEYVETLYPRHLQLFMKQLRKNFKQDYGFENIRFFAAGEYGDENGRPHYHVILFNCPIPDLQLDFAEDGFLYYTSQAIQNAWADFTDRKNPSTRGKCIITDFSFDTAAYVARYMLKKHKGLDKGYYEENGIEPEFTRCSRRPGIGRDYFEQHQDEIYKYDSLVLPGSYGSVQTCTPPKYFDRVYAEEHEEELAELKKRRKESAIASMESQLSRTDLSQEEYLQVKENNKAFNSARFVRPL